VKLFPTVQIEDGTDRLAELRQATEIKSQLAQTSQVKQNTYTQATKKIELNDVWETFKINFSVFHPEDVVIKISGSRPEIGSYTFMNKIPTNKSWMQ
jgi:hypothetical protein